MFLTVPDGDKFKVFKKGENGEALGRALGSHPNAEEAQKQIDGMIAVASGDKDYGDYAYYHRRLDPDDPRAAYNPMGGFTGGKACANCFWFNARNAACDVVWGEIVATGVSNMWLAKEQPKPAGITPMPVYIVNPEVDAAGAGIDSKANEAAQAAAVVKEINEVRERSNSLLDRVAAALGLAGKAAPAKPAAEPVADSGFKVYDSGRWIGWYSNTAEDRSKEWFPGKATDSFIQRVKSEVVPYPELWHKHLPIQMGRADFLTRIGYLTFATGTFYDTPAGQAGKAYYEAEQKAGRPKTMSHGFLFPRNLKVNGEYLAYNTYEISPLDPGEECNPYTNFEVKAMFAKLDQKGLAEIEKIFGKDEAQRLVTFGETKSRDLEAAGVSFKSFDNVEVTDTQAHEGLKNLAEATVAGLKKISGQLDELATSVKTAQTTGDEAKAAVAEVKAYVEKEFGYTPRASQSAAAAAKANPLQVQQLQDATAAAGKAKDGGAPADAEADEGAKSIFDHILEAAGNARAAE
jgi:hypothetical protein